MVTRRVSLLATLSDSPEGTAWRSRGCKPVQTPGKIAIRTRESPEGVTLVALLNAPSPFGASIRFRFRFQQDFVRVRHRVASVIQS